MALEAGYRHFDTAAMYGNETGVGRGIGSLSGFAATTPRRFRRGSPALSREDLFVTTKLWNDDQGYDATLRAFDTSMANLGLEYVDLYLIHWPCAKRGLFTESYRAMETLYREGKARAIGVSNFQPAHLDRLLQTAEVVPAVNQIELHPWLQQEELRTLHRELGISTEAWSPLGRGQVLQDPVVLDLAAAHGGPRRRSSSAGMSSSATSPSPKRAPTPGSARTWTSSASASTTPPWPPWPVWNAASAPAPTRTPSIRTYRMEYVDTESSPARPCSAPGSRPAPAPPGWSWTAPGSRTGPTSRSA